jgi:hypothetical protein
VREAALLDLAVRALPSHLDQERRRRLGFSFGSRSEKEDAMEGSKESRRRGRATGGPARKALIRYVAHWATCDCPSLAAKEAQSFILDVLY